MLNAIKRLISALLDSMRAYTWFWVGGAGVVLAGVAALLIFGNLFGPSGKTICEIARFKAVQFGVLGSDTVLEGSGKSGEIEGRRECTLTSGGETYIATTDLACDDISKEESEMKAIEDGKPISPDLLGDFKRCISLYAVERSDGLTLYQKLAVPNDVPEDAAKTDGEDGAEPSPAPERSATPDTSDLEVVKAPQQ